VRGKKNCIFSSWGTSEHVGFFSRTSKKETKDVSCIVGFFWTITALEQYIGLWIHLGAPGHNPPVAEL